MSGIKCQLVLRRSTLLLLDGFLATFRSACSLYITMLYILANTRRSLLLFLSRCEMQDVTTSFFYISMGVLSRLLFLSYGSSKFYKLSPLLEVFRVVGKPNILYSPSQVNNHVRFLTLLPAGLLKVGIPVSLESYFQYLYQFI